MTSTPPLPRVEHLEPARCWNLLRGTSVGRLALWRGDHPDIFPINYKVDHGTLVFRTGEGTKLQAALGEVPVALEVDGVQPDSTTAWSVVVKGEATAIELTRDILDTVGLILLPWQGGHKDHFIRITPTSITGRRFTVISPLMWWSPLDDDLRARFE